MRAVIRNRSTLPTSSRIALVIGAVVMLAAAAISFYVARTAANRIADAKDGLALVSLGGPEGTATLRSILLVRFRNEAQQSTVILNLMRLVMVLCGAMAAWCIAVAGSRWSTPGSEDGVSPHGDDLCAKPPASTAIRKAGRPLPSAKGYCTYETCRLPVA